MLNFFSFVNIFFSLFVKKKFCIKVAVTLSRIQLSHQFFFLSKNNQDIRENSLDFEKKCQFVRRTFPSVIGVSLNRETGDQFLEAFHGSDMFRSVVLTFSWLLMLSPDSFIHVAKAFDMLQVSKMSLC